MTNGRATISVTLLVSLVLTSFGSPRRAWADGGGNQRADRLFNEALTLLKAGKFADACPKLEESDDLDPALGTEFNLADCYEQLGKYAKAYAVFRDVETGAKAAGKETREREAHDRAGALTAKIGRLKFVSRSNPAEVPLVGHVFVDAVSFPIHGGVVAVEPGPHFVTAVVGEEETPFRTKVSPSAGETTEVPVVTSHGGGKPDAAKTEAAGGPFEAAPPVTITHEEKLAVHNDPPDDHKTQRSVGIALAAAGGVGLVVGGIFGALAIGKKSDAGCDGVVCPPGQGDSLRAAQSSAAVATLGFVAGGVLGAAGITLIVLSKPAGSSAIEQSLLAPSAPSARIVASATGIRVGGAF